YVVVSDGRSHLATAERFVEADVVRVLPERLDVRAGDAAVVMTHSFEQDTQIISFLLDRPQWPVYVGVLGPQRRTRELLEAVAQQLDLVPSEHLIENWLLKLHAPTGLDLGAETPATIALSIVAEVQKVLAHGTALPLRQVRAMKAATQV
ncbi:MAG TPA: XdhC family protein, partial [Terracidiphilus sp.]